MDTSSSNETRGQEEEEEERDNASKELERPRSDN